MSLIHSGIGGEFMNTEVAIKSERVSPEEYIDFLKRSDLGSQFGLTDFAYWLYVTDLGVDRDYVRQGIGRRLMKAAHELAGGEKDIAVYLIANENAVPFYEKLGMKKADDVMQYNHIEWTEFTVSGLDTGRWDCS